MSMKDRIGQKVPSVTFPVLENNEWKSVTTDDLFKDKTVVVFALPGAFTPTCSSTHLPRYNELAPVFKANGVDDIICLSVNDPFVMNEWKKDLHADNITLIPDGNGDFSKGMEMLVNKSEIGFGHRSWRYSMLVRDGVIEQQFIENEEPGDPFKVSDADTMLNFINKDAAEQPFATVFSKPGCPFCVKAKEMLAESGIEFEEIELGKGISNRSLRAVSGKLTWPQVYIAGEHIGGSEELKAFLSK